MIITQFAFIDNTFNDEQYQHSQDTFTDHQKIISRGFYDKSIDYVDITLNNCFFDCLNEKIILTTNYALQTNGCNFNASENNLNLIEQLDLGECKGKKSAAPMTPALQFTNSFEFSNSFVFSKSKEFSKSDMFSKTDCFTVSNYFSQSDVLPTSHFTMSKKFSNSDEFSFSNSFETPVDRDANAGDGKKIMLE